MRLLDCLKQENRDLKDEIRNLKAQPALYSEEFEERLKKLVWENLCLRNKVRLLEAGSQAVETPSFTKREIFAAMAMHGMISAKISGYTSRDNTAEAAVQYADALIKALEEKR